MSTRNICSKKTKLIISCFYGSNNPSVLPVGFDWAQILSTQYRTKYDITILLHGECIPYGLNNETYQMKYGTDNPFAKLLGELYFMQHVTIVICHLCLIKDGFNRNQLFKFVSPIPFSIDYIAQSQLEGKIVIYDAQAPHTQ